MSTDVDRKLAEETRQAVLKGQQARDAARQSVAGAPPEMSMKSVAAAVVASHTAADAPADLAPQPEPLTVIAPSDKLNEYKARLKRVTQRIKNGEPK